MPSKKAATMGTCGRAPRWMAYIAIVVLLGVLVALLYQWFVTRKVREMFDESAPYRMIYVHMQGCGHCERFKPTWDEFVKTRGTELRLKGVSVEDFDRASPEWAAMKLDVSGFPTVLMVETSSKKSIATFDKDRTADNLYSWALSAIA